MLYIVPTPIGNLEDITLRASRVLAVADVIISEDPRVTRKLLNLAHIESNAKIVQYLKNHEFNYGGITKTLQDLKNNVVETVAVVSDAGMPGLSDPARQIIEYAQEHDITYTVLPGADSITTAVVASGLVHKEFVFIGFLPIKKGRAKAWKSILESQYPVVIFESVHRFNKFLSEATKYLDAETSICVCRELTKQHEQIWVGKVEMLERLEFMQKGEFVIIIRNNGRIKTVSTL